MISIKMPNYPDIILPEYYEQLAGYYPNAEPQTKQWMIEHVKPDWECMDCGAHIGIYTILLSDLAHQGDVYALEPTITMGMLRANVVYNGRANVYLHQQAVGLYSGKFLESIFRIWGEPPEVMAYDFTTIDDFIKDSRLDFLKIDVDSFDLEALMGAQRTLHKQKPIICVELNDALRIRGNSPLEAIEYMKSHSYEVETILDGENYLMRSKA